MTKKEAEADIQKLSRIVSWSHAVDGRGLKDRSVTFCNCVAPYRWIPEKLRRFWWWAILREGVRDNLQCLQVHVLSLVQYKKSTMISHSIQKLVILSKSAKRRCSCHTIIFTLKALPAVQTVLWSWSSCRLGHSHRLSQVKWDHSSSVDLCRFVL